MFIGLVAKAALGDINASLNHLDAVNEKRRHNWAILAVFRYVMLYNHQRLWCNLSMDWQWIGNGLVAN